MVEGIIIAVLILAVLVGIPLTIWAAQRDMLKHTWVYHRTGGKYIPRKYCRLKDPTTKTWFDAVIYESVEDGASYVREVKDFYNNFVKYADWDGNKK